MKRALIRCSAWLALLAACLGIVTVNVRATWHLGTSREQPGKPAAELHAGFGEADITPAVGDRPVYLAGFGRNRKATKVHDPLLARAVVLRHGDRKVALVSLDLVGLFHDSTERVRKQLPGFTYILLSCTHNHEGPDTLGLWSPPSAGLDRAYLERVEKSAVKAVRQAEAALRPVEARLGTARAPELLRDSREPYVKHDELVALRLHEPGGEKNVGLVVQWNCHPETLDSKNTEVSADFVGYTVRHLRGRHHCPVVYFSGTVGGLLTSLGVEVRDDKGRPLADGTFEKTERYGRLVGELADRALKTARPVRLTPLQARARSIFLPVDNTRYLFAARLGILKREVHLWKGDPSRAEPVADLAKAKGRLCVRSEVAWLRLGELEVAAIPGEIYPELVLDRVQDPPDPGADFPKAPIEPAVYKQLRGRHRMLIGLANDEVGYIIPKRQWDAKAPYCYGRKRPQYGEENSLGPDTAPLLCGAFRELASGKRD
jgi:hypothetical protein